jgi:hypothetical protein
MTHYSINEAFAQGLKLLFSGWLGVYGLCLLVALARPLAFFVLSGFEMAPTYEAELLNTLRTAAIWLLPTGFLAVAVRISQDDISEF